MSIQIILAFFGLAFLMALSPGPNLLYLASRSAVQGRAAGFSSLGGVCFGMLTVPLVYELVRFAGVAYLVWLAYKLFAGKNSVFSSPELAPESKIALFKRGLLICLLNPKIALMYGAFLPQFVDVSIGFVPAQLIVLGLIQILAAALAHSVVIVFSSSIEILIKNNRTYSHIQRYLLGTVFLALAARLAQERQAVS